MFETSNPQTYLNLSATGAPTFGGVSSFASNEYTWNQTHMSNAVSLKATRAARRLRPFGIELQLSAGYMLNPFTVAPTGLGYSQNGKITRNDGTDWQNADAKSSGAPSASMGPTRSATASTATDTISTIRLTRPRSGTPSTGTGQLYSDGIGETRTGALWAQDAWKIVPTWKLTLGGRLETGGRSTASTSIRAAMPARHHHIRTTAINQPELRRPTSRRKHRCPSTRTRTGI